jgi:DNA modification methylase
VGLAYDQIHLGDCRDLLAQLDTETVDLLFTSPPFHVGKSYERDCSTADWEALLVNAVQLGAAALKPGAFFVLNVADIRAYPDPELGVVQAECIHWRRSPVTLDQIEALLTSEPWLSEAELGRRLGCSAQTIARRRRGHLARGRSGSSELPPTRLRPVGSLIERAAAHAGLVPWDKRIWMKGPNWHGSPWAASSLRAIDEYEELWFLLKPGPIRYRRERLTREEWSAWGSRATWRLPSVAVNGFHPAMFPVELPRRVIRLLTDPGDLIIDPFVGSGTSALAARELGRHFIGIDSEAAYVALARNRLRATP